MTVYPVREDTLFLKRNLPGEMKDIRFLEVGVGNGEISLEAAERGACVTAVDINPEAVSYAEKRFEEVNLEAEIFSSDLFGNIDRKFDLIVFNPPYLDGPEGIGDEKMWRGGEKGTGTARRFLENVDEYLLDKGEVWIVMSSRTDYQEILDDFSLEQIDEEKIWFERLFLYRLE